MKKGDRVVVKKRGPGVILGFWWLSSGGRQVQMAEVQLDAGGTVPAAVANLEAEATDGD